MARTGNPHIAARFFVANARFHGLCTIEELKYVLEAYDTGSAWPKGSGITYLRYFAPEAFDRGHRFSNCASAFWEALTELLPLESQSVIEFPMQHIAYAVENALFRLAEGEEWDDVTDKASWRNMLTEADYSGHMSMIQVAA